MHDDIQDLLDFGTTNVYYVVWNTNGKIYYLLDTSPDFQFVKWTKDRDCAVFFYAEAEATKCARAIRNVGRPGVSIITAEISVLEDLEEAFP